MDEICAITLDLDDTLWPVEPVIEAAEHRLYEWLSVYCPRITRSHSVDSMREVRLTVAKCQAEIAHDLTEVRRRSLEQLIVTEGTYPPEYVDHAMAEFLEHRNNVEFFPDALPFLNQVSGSFPLLSISNGNADPQQIGLSDLFVSHVSAIDVGAAKPDSKIFQTACNYLALAPKQILHIGDHPIQDILGAAQIGMKTVWVNRTGAYWDEQHNADYEVTSLEQVLDLLLLHSFGDPE